MSDQKAQIGVIGLAVMGKNLALNIESRGFTVGVYNRHRERTDEMMRDHSEKKLVPSYSLEDFVNSLEKPRRILMMVQAGKGTDAVIDGLLPLLDKGDVLIDGGNTNFHSTSTTRWSATLSWTSPGSSSSAWGFPVGNWVPCKVLP